VVAVVVLVALAVATTEDQVEAVVRT